MERTFQRFSIPLTRRKDSGMDGFSTPPPPTLSLPLGLGQQFIDVGAPVVGSTLVTRTSPMVPLPMLIGAIPLMPLLIGMQFRGRRGVVGI